jgi:kynurenine formamidase
MQRSRLLLTVSAVTVFALLPAGNPTKAASKPSMTAKDIENMMTSLSNWGRWGKQDELGALNLITPQKRKAAAGEVKEGVSVSMAHNAIKVATEGSPAFEHKMTATGQDPKSTGANDGYAVQYHGYTVTHMDALCHLFYQGKMYNGFSQKEVTEKGAGKNSVINIKNGLFTRAVLMDIPRLRGVKFLKGGTAIYPEDLDAWLTKAGVKLETGDAVLIRTGRWARRAAEGLWKYEENTAGLHASCLPWLKKHDVAVVGSDLATDVLPSGVEGVNMPLHQVLIVAMGTPILDNCDFEAVGEAANTRKRWSFLLTTAPLAVDGGTGSPINPIAVF